MYLFKSVCMKVDLNTFMYACQFGKKGNSDICFCTCSDLVILLKLFCECITQSRQSKNTGNKKEGKTVRTVNPAA